MLFLSSMENYVIWTFFSRRGVCARATVFATVRKRHRAERINLICEFINWQCSFPSVIIHRVRWSKSPLSHATHSTKLITFLSSARFCLLPLSPIDCTGTPDNWLLAAFFSVCVRAILFERSASPFVNCARRRCLLACTLTMQWNAHWERQQ